MNILEELSVEHDYYCSESNFYSNEPATTWTSMSDFLDEMEDADIDMNLVFRWDVIEKRDDNDRPMGVYRAEVFIMKQRKGIFMPNWIESITEREAERFKVYLEKHWNKLQKIWEPIS